MSTELLIGIVLVIIAIVEVAVVVRTVGSTLPR